MDSGERVLTALHCGVPDRVPVNYFANPGIDGRLKRHFGLEASDNEGLLLALGVDFRRVEPPYRGPKLHPDYPERGVISDCWGNRMRKVEHGSGCYWDFCEFPLAEAGPEEVAAWPMPSPDDFDYSGIAEQCRRWRSFAVCVGDPGTADVINSSGRVRGMEQTLIDFALDEPAGTLLAERRAEIQLEVLRRTIEAGCYSPDGLKSQARPGMGTCQGRMCSAAVAEMIAHAHGLPIETLPPYHAQPPLFPLPLEELASMSIPPEGL